MFSPPKIAQLSRNQSIDSIVGKVHPEQLRPATKFRRDLQYKDSDNSIFVRSKHTFTGERATHTHYTAMQKQQVQIRTVPEI